MNEHISDEVGTGGHCGLDNTSIRDIHKKLTAKIHEGIRDGSIAPENKRERDMYLDAKAAKDAEREEPYSDMQADANALASAGYGTDEDYGSASELL